MEGGDTISDKSIVDLRTGESEPVFLANKRKRKIMYSKWYAVNQEKEGERVKKELAKTLYTTKGRVYHYLASMMEYGNFSPFVPSHITKALDITSQSLYKARKQLIEDGLILLAEDTVTGVKGVVFPNIAVQKGEENPNIKIISKESE